MPALREVPAGRAAAHVEGLPNPRGFPRHLQAVGAQSLPQQEPGELHGSTSQPPCPEQGAGTEIFDSGAAICEAHVRLVHLGEAGWDLK